MVNEYRYLWLIEDEILARRNLKKYKLERYDFDKKEWIPDWDLSEVYTGDVRYRGIEESYAKEVIKNGGFKNRK